MGPSTGRRWLKLGDFTLTVSFGFTKEGKAEIVVGGSGSQASTHTMTLTFTAF